MATRRHRTRTPAQVEYDPRTVVQNIVDIPLKEEMSTSFLAYAYSVIYSRALPDARDGLKPVQRRIVYQMGQMHLTPDKPYMKSARAVGEVMGKLHPHGDSSIYEAMVRLAQPFAMRLPLVDGHGNFGSLDDGPAASRYTEARLAAAALGMNADIDEGTVPFSPNYDNKLQEPDVLPSAIPNLLVNGSTGIAVGMATSMVTHNVGETIAAASYLLRNPDASVDNLMEFIPGPDLPGGGVIIGTDGIKQAYETGKGSFVTRARTHIENVTARKKSIVVTELPYMVGPEKVLERIAAAVKDRKLDGISNAVDLSDRHNGLKLVITVKSGYDPTAVLAQLYKCTPMESCFTINNVALVNGRPRTLGLRQLLQVWIDHRRDVIRRRSEFRKNKDKEHLHLVRGLLLALLDIDKVISVIRGVQNQEAAKQALMNEFGLDDAQTKYILDLQLRRLTKMSRLELETEQNDLLRRIAQLEAILASPAKLDETVLDEMNNAVRQWNDPRRTLILRSDGTVAARTHAVTSVDNSGNTIHWMDEIGSDNSSPFAVSGSKKAERRHSTRSDVFDNAEAMAVLIPKNSGTTNLDSLKIADKPCAVLLGASGLIGRAPLGAADKWDSWNATMPRAKWDDVLSVIRTTTRSRFGIVTSAGRLVLVSAMDLPILDGDEGLSLVGGIGATELLQGTRDTDPVEGEKAVALVVDLTAAAENSSQEASELLAMGTRFGVVKRWNGVAPTTKDSWTVMSLKEGDAILGAAPASDDDTLAFVSSDANVLLFPASSVRPQGRSSAGMAGIKLHEGCSALAFAVVPRKQMDWQVTVVANWDDRTPAVAASGAVLLTIAGESSALPGTESGYAKLTPLDEYPSKGRATQGVRAQRFLKGQDVLIGACVGRYPLHAVSDVGDPVELPAIDHRRDGSGVELTELIGSVS